MQIVCDLRFKEHEPKKHGEHNDKEQGQRRPDRGLEAPSKCGRPRRERIGRRAAAYSEGPLRLPFSSTATTR